MTQVDARGCLCPQPLMMMTRQMKEAGCTAFAILVDNVTARENICRTAESRGWRIAAAVETGGDFLVTLSRK